MEKARLVTKAALQKCEDKNKSAWSYKKSIIRDDLRDFLYEKTKRKPMILPIIMEI